MTTPILKALAELEDTDNRAKKWADKEYDPEKFKGPFKHHDIRYTYARGAASMLPAVQAVKVLVEALEKIESAAKELYEKDNTEFMAAPKGSPGGCWDAPSRHLQTFKWLGETTAESLADCERILSEGKK